MRAVNWARAQHGLTQVKVGPRLQRRSHYWARRIIVTNVFAHSTSLGAGVRENLAAGPIDSMGPYRVVRRWLNSPAHRANVLLPGATRAGFGVARGELWGYSGMEASVLRIRR